MDKSWTRAKRLASILIEENCHLKQFDVAFSEPKETEMIAQAIREQGHSVELQGNRLHVVCK